VPFFAAPHQFFINAPIFFAQTLAAPVGRPLLHVLYGITYCHSIDGSKLQKNFHPFKLQENKVTKEK
jgi:hypothetical protein